MTIGFVTGHYFEIVFIVLKPLLAIFFVLGVLEGYFLFYRGRIEVKRTVEDRLSNGDDNSITLSIKSHYRIPVDILILEDLPEQLQIRDFEIRLELSALEELKHGYKVTPTSRGIYRFYYANTLISTKLGLVQRRIKAAAPVSVAVYPSFIHINNIELAAISDQLQMQGQKRIRKIGNSREFDSIRSYVIGDDPRNINWRATARTNTLQVNEYVDERSQSMYCLIDKSRSMKMPFKGMTLLEYAINASLVLSHVALKKGDQSGVLTFEHKPSTFIKSSKRNIQINLILQALYAEQTSFNEVDFQSLYPFVQQKVTSRSLMVLFTNFESIHSLDRQLPYFQMLNQKHLLLVVFFKNTELDHILDGKPETTEQIFQKALAAQLVTEKEMIVERLERSGILALHTAPEDLSVSVVNRYIEIKKQRVL